MRTRPLPWLAALTGAVIGLGCLVGTADAAATTVTSLASADTYSDGGAPATNFGTATTLKVRQPYTRRIYMRIPVPAGTGGITKSLLKLYATGTCNLTPSVGPVTANWGETSLTSNNRPVIGAAFGRVPSRSGAGWVQLDVTAKTPDTGVLSIGIWTTVNGSCTYASREAGSAQAPRLVVTRDSKVSPTPTPSASPTPTPTPTATLPPANNDPVVAAVGDLSCDPTDQNYNNGLGQGSYCQGAAVAELVASMNPTNLLALGDLQYEDGTLAKFQSSYVPWWGRFDPIVKPVVGNHEYLDPGAAGYYAYFGSKAGDPTQGWYSYDIGTWHLIVLNSECDQVGGCGAGSPQETWLKADLAAHTNQCVMAMWHRPRFTSGEFAAATTPQGQTTFWQDLYTAKADLVLAGHIHNYERFAATDANGTPDTAGLRQFVVGTGGKSLVGFNATTWPSSEVRDATHYGALRLVLHPNSYDWQFLPIGGGAPIDAGSQPCH